MVRASRSDQPVAARLSRRHDRGLYRSRGRLDFPQRNLGPRSRRRRLRRGQDARGRRDRAGDPRVPGVAQRAHDPVRRQHAPHRAQGRHRAADLLQHPVRANRRRDLAARRRRDRRRLGRAHARPAHRLFDTMARRAAVPLRPARAGAALHRQRPRGRRDDRRRLAGSGGEPREARARTETEPQRSFATPAFGGAK